MYIINIKFNFRSLRYLLLVVFNNNNNTNNLLILPGIVDRQVSFIRSTNYNKL